MFCELSQGVFCFKKKSIYNSFVYSIRAHFMELFVLFALSMFEWRNCFLYLHTWHATVWTVLVAETLIAVCTFAVVSQFDESLLTLWKWDLWMLMTSFWQEMWRLFNDSQHYEPLPPSFITHIHTIWRLLSRRRRESEDGIRWRLKTSSAPQSLWRVASC